MKELNLMTKDAPCDTMDSIKILESDNFINVDAETYNEIAVKLKEAIGDTSFFNGSIDTDRENIYSTLTATLIVYHTDESYPEGNFHAISDIVPVWWEYSTTLAGEGELLNDFCFYRLKEAFLSIN